MFNVLADLYLFIGPICGYLQLISLCVCAFVVLLKIMCV